MALRLIELIIPDARRAQVREALDDVSTLGVWSQPLDDDEVRLSVLVETTKSESVLDLLERRLAWTEGFRIVLLPVEGTLPRRPEPEGDAKAKDAGDGKSPGPSLPQRISRTELLDDLATGVKTSKVYFAFVLLSTVVAAVGLIRSDTAIVIGAMVIAPLLTPNMALALATTLGDLSLARKALTTTSLGVLTAFVFSLLLGVLVPFDPAMEAIQSRTSVSLADIAVALAAGSAGALAFTSGVPAGLVGVMVAVALLPPLVVTGLLLGAGDYGTAVGALLLVTTNVVCVNLTGVLTFWVQGIRPRTWWEADKARKARNIALALWGTLLVALTVLVAVSQSRGS